jgi:hypothetical protein
MRTYIDGMKWTFRKECMAELPTGDELELLDLITEQLVELIRAIETTDSTTPERAAVARETLERFGLWPK